MVEINTTIENDHMLITVKGEVDASSSIELDNALKAAIDEAPKIMVDLSQLEYISSAGLGVFISYLDDIKTKGTRLVLVGMKEKVLEVFEILGLQNLMTIASSKEEGLEKLK